MRRPSSRSGNGGVRGGGCRVVFGDMCFHVVVNLVDHPVLLLHQRRQRRAPTDLRLLLLVVLLVHDLQLGYWLPENLPLRRHVAAATAAAGAAATASATSIAAISAAPTLCSAAGATGRRPLRQQRHCVANLERQPEL